MDTVSPPVSYPPWSQMSILYSAPSFQSWPPSLTCDPALGCWVGETLHKLMVWNHCNSMVKDILLEVEDLVKGTCAYMALLWNSYSYWSWCWQFLWKSVLWILAKAEEDVFLFQHEWYFSNGNDQCKLFRSPTAGWQNQHEEVIRQLGPDEIIVKLEWKA